MDDWFTWGFVAMILVFMVIKVLYQRKMYKDSVYRVIYSAFTEYRVRRKSIEGMSESYLFRDTFGPHRIIYSVVDSKKYHPFSFITVFLNTGCYVFGVCTKTPDEKSLSVCWEFYEKNIQKKLKDTVYDPGKLPVTCKLIVPDAMTQVPEKDYIIRRSGLVECLRTLQSQRKAQYSAEDVEHLFKIVAAEVLKKEDDSRLGTMLTKDS